MEDGGRNEKSSAPQVTKEEPISHVGTQQTEPHLPWLNEMAVNQNLFMLQPDCTYIDPLGYDGAVDFSSGLGEENDASIGRILALESGEINSFQPIPSPVTIEAPFPSAGSGMKCGSVEIEAASSVSHLELPASLLPASLLGQSSLKEHSIKIYHSQSAPVDANDIDKNVGTLNINYNCTSVFIDEIGDPTRFAKASTEEVRKIFRTSGCDFALRISQYWCHYQQLLQTMEQRVHQILNDRGVKIKRRKRMGPEVPAIEKKEIRAQRNRERSQALRRHHKKRLSDLEEAGEQMRVYNSATRALINCVLEHESALPLLHNYFTENDCSENLLAFLSNGH